MKLYDIKIGVHSEKDRTFWQNIGTIFASDDAKLTGANGKPATFVMNFPKANGIVVPREKKENKE